MYTVVYRVLFSLVFHRFVVVDRIHIRECLHLHHGVCCFKRVFLKCLQINYTDQKKRKIREPVCALIRALCAVENLKQQERKP